MLDDTPKQEHPGTYLGDGLYVRCDGYQVELHSFNGIESTNRVFLGPDEMSSLIGYWKRLRGES